MTDINVDLDAILKDNMSQLVIDEWGGTFRKLMTAAIRADRGWR